MKKCFVLLLTLITFLHMGLYIAFADDTILAIHGGAHDSPVLIPEDYYGKTYYREVNMLDSIIEYYYLIAPSEGEYTFSVWQTFGGTEKLGGQGLVFYIFDAEGNIVTSFDVLHEVQEIKYEVLEKDEICFLAVAGGNGLLNHNVYFTTEFGAYETTSIECDAKYEMEDGKGYISITFSNHTEDDIIEPMVMLTIYDSQTPQNLMYANTFILEELTVHTGETRIYKHFLSEKYVEKIVQYGIGHIDCKVEEE